MTFVTGRWQSLGVLVLIGAAACGESGSNPSSSSAEAGEAGAAEPPVGGAGGATVGVAEGGAGQAGHGAADPGAAAGADDAGAGAGAGGVETEPAHAGAGGNAGGSAGANAGGEAAATLPGERVFADSVLEVRVTLDEAVWQDLEAHGDLEEYVAAAASLQVAGGPTASFAKLGLRHKGAWSLHHCWDQNGGVRSYQGECAKLSYKLKFDEYAADGRFDGLKRLNLHASSGDLSKLRELLAYQTFRDAGVDAPRAMPARLYINDQLQGLFIAVEDIDGRYAKAHFPDAADGNLYKEIWPRSERTDRDFAAALETDDDPADVSDMRAFATAIAGSNAESFLTDVAPFVEIEPLLRYIAVDRMLRNWDGITAFYSPFTPHNFYWYHDNGAQDRFHLVPWDLDNTFWSYDPYMYPEPQQQVPGVPDITVKPFDCQPRVVWSPGSGTYITPPRCDKFLDLLMQTSFEGLADVAAQLRQTALNPTRLQELVDHYQQIIEPIVALDPTLNVSQWNGAVAELSSIFADSAADFDALIAAGLTEELGPEPDPEAPTQEELDAPTLDDGLHVPGITNFEFAEPPAALAFVEPHGDSRAIYVAKWNTTQPLSGTADLLFNFTFARGPAAYDEWVNVFLFSQEADVTAKTGVAVLLSSDVTRQVRINVWSPVYDDDFGGVWSEFGVNRTVGPTPVWVKVDFSELAYPDYARAAWTPGQGFPGTDAEAKALVLSRFAGLIFGPSATFDGAGELTSETETGWLHVDNIYFR